MDGRHGCGLDLKAEARGEPNGAEHPQMVFFEALVGVADGPDDAGVEVGQAVDVIDDGEGREDEEYEEYKTEGSRSRALMVKSRRRTSCRGIRFKRYASG